MLITKEHNTATCHSIGARRNFRKGGGGNPKKGTPHEERSSKKVPIRRKTWQKRPLRREKVTKSPPPYRGNKFPGEGVDRLLLPPPLRAPMCHS